MSTLSTLTLRISVDPADPVDSATPIFGVAHGWNPAAPPASVPPDSLPGRIQPIIAGNAPMIRAEAR